MVDDRSGRTDPALLKAAIADLGRAMTALAALDQALDRLCGRDAPGLGKIRGVAIEIGDFAVGALAARKAVAAPAAADPAPATPPAPPRQAPPATMSRAEAYRQLAAIADILRASEPHSPVPDVLDQLVSWRDLSMIELDSALRRNGSNVAILLESLGFLASQGGESPNS
jgi:predicted component of type VI protein secretion system